MAFDMLCPNCGRQLHDDHNGFFSCYADGCDCSGATLDTWITFSKTKTKLNMALGQLEGIVADEKTPQLIRKAILQTLKEIRKI